MKPTWTSDCGTVELYQGDCLEILPTLGKVDAVVTDPPYGVNGSVTGYNRCRNRGSATHYNPCFDDTPENVASVVVPAIDKCIGISGCVAVSPGFKCMNLYPPPDHIGGFYYGGQSTITAWGAAWWQPVLFYGDDPKKGRLQRDMFTATTKPKNPSNPHPCPKELDSWLLVVERVSIDGSTILDPFMGSGTTGVAAVRLGRKFTGIELDPQYFETAKQRILDELNRYPLFDEPKETQSELFAESTQ